jgi:hypothetical protein
VWHELDDRGFLVDTEERLIDTTVAGDKALFEWIEYSAARGVRAA